MFSTSRIPRAFRHTMPHTAHTVPTDGIRVLAPSLGHNPPLPSPPSIPFNPIHFLQLYFASPRISSYPNRRRTLLATQSSCRFFHDPVHHPRTFFLSEPRDLGTPGTTVLCSNAMASAKSNGPPGPGWAHKDGNRSRHWSQPWHGPTSRSPNRRRRARLRHPGHEQNSIASRAPALARARSSGSPTACMAQGLQAPIENLSMQIALV